MAEDSTPMPNQAEGSSPLNALTSADLHKASALLSDVVGKKEMGKASRSAWEATAIRALRSFRDQDNGSFRDSEQSKVSLRTSKVKTRAAAAQIKEALFQRGKFPLLIKESKEPFGIPKFVHLSEGQPPAEEQQPVEQNNKPEPLYLPNSIGFSGDGRQLNPGATFSSLFQNVDPEIVEQATATGQIKEGVGKLGEPTISPAKMAASRMNSHIHDQLEATMVIDELEKMINEMCIIGTGVMKGPFNEYKEIPYWRKNEDGSRTYEPKKILVPKLSYVSVWDFFVDPSATSVEDAEWVIERHKMNETQLRRLKNRPMFDTVAIDRLIHDGPNYTTEDGNDSEREDPNLNTSAYRSASLYELYEYWGYLSVDKVREYGLEVPEDAEDYVQVCVWYSDRELLRVSLNPFQPNCIPYYMTPYESDPYSIYGVGVPEAMADQQRLINGFLRMAVDNLALAGNMVFDVDESALAPGQPMEISPGQIFRRIGGNPGQAVYGIKFPSTANENLQMVREMRQQADEATGIPSISHGQTGVSGTGRTASGMSMLLNNASLNIKSVVRNIDRHVIKPIGHAMFAWNMQYNSQAHPDIEGDLEICATGSASLEQKDVENQRLQVFLSLSANPALAPLIKLSTIIKRLAETMDLDPEEILNTPEEAAFYSFLISQMQAVGQAAQNPETAGAAAPQPNQTGFTGNTESAGNPEGANGAVPGVNAPEF